MILGHKRQKMGRGNKQAKERRTRTQSQRMVRIEAYDDNELAVIVPTSQVEGGDKFPFDFDGVWRRLGYSAKDKAVRALHQVAQEGSSCLFPV